MTRLDKRDSIRLNWADSLKGFLILLVILGHSIQYTLGNSCYSNHLWNIIYSFHMPAFMAISGFLAYRGGGGILSIRPTIWRRFRQLMIPFFLWTLLLMLIGGNVSLKLYLRLFLYPDKGLWFLWSLFFITLLFQLSKWVATKLNLKHAVVVLCVGVFLAISMVLFKTNLFAIQFIAYYYIYYSLAYYFHKYYNIIVTENKLIVFLLIVAWILMAWFWNMHYAPEFLKLLPLPHSVVNYMYRFVTALIAIYTLMIVAPKILDNTKEWNVLIMKIGQISLGIYSIHFMFLRKIVPWLKEIGINDNFTILLSFGITTLCAWGLITLLSKWKLTSQFFLGKI